MGPEKTYPLRWEWKAGKAIEVAYFVNFLSVARINEATIYVWVPLKGGTIMVNVKSWNDDSLAVVKNISSLGENKRGSKKSQQFPCTTCGWLYVDMCTRKETCLVRIKAVVVDYAKNSKMLNSPLLS